MQIKMPVNLKLVPKRFGIVSMFCFSFVLHVRASETKFQFYFRCKRPITVSKPQNNARTQSGLQTSFSGKLRLSLFTHASSFVDQDKNNSQLRTAAEITVRDPCKSPPKRDLDRFIRLRGVYDHVDEWISEGHADRQAARQTRHTMPARHTRTRATMTT